MRKTGRLSKIEQQYIRDNAFHKTYTQIASELNRDEQTIRNFIEKNMDVKTNLATNSRPIIQVGKVNVREKPFWTTLQGQFTDDELVLFEYQWNQIIEQFDNDILPTEELQIIDVIRFEVLMNRNLRQSHEITKNISILEYQIQQEKNGEQNVDLLNNLERQVGMFRAAQNQSTKEVRELQEKKNGLLQALKATRADRIKRIENKKENFFTWLEELIENPKKRKEMGLAMEKMRLSIIDEQVRLAAYHKYINGQLDQPILTAETVREDNE